ncbi:hypothetical protein [Fodinicola feengrottensis]|uniref:Uncharacterized protein n=1 Tax=Fodinicola feengrottensis TaxID=435914 RepID=A0ABN2GVW8_9ACTN|nr:hypothetical protein [Fodinicola feengrottensis]
MAEKDEQQAKPHRLFDLRYLIGALFTVYGVILVIVGALDGSAALSKAQGIRINLWLGISMLVLAGLFLLWAWLRPLSADSND